MSRGESMPFGLVFSSVGNGSTDSLVRIESGCADVLFVAGAGIEEGVKPGRWHPGLPPPPILNEPHLPDPLAQIDLPHFSQIRDSLGLRVPRFQSERVIETCKRINCLCLAEGPWKALFPVGNVCIW